jgi:soluble lytic murein transglycosylase
MSFRRGIVNGVLLFYLLTGYPLQAMQMPQVPAERLLGEALQLIQSGHSQAALTPLRQISTAPLYNDLSPTWQRRLPFLLGYHYLQTGDFSKATLYLERAREEYPELQDYTLWYLAEGLLRLNRLQGARTALQWLLDAFPESLHRSEALFQAAEANARLGDLQRAADLYAQYRWEYPEGSRRDEVYLRLGIVQRDLGNPQAALREWRHLWLEHPEDAAADQVPALERTLPQSFTPPAPTADELYRRAERLYRLNRHRDALRAFELARAAAPAQPLTTDLLYRIGTAQYYARENQAAVATFQQVYARAPQSSLASGALFMQARLYLRMENDEGFLETARTLLARFPGSKHAEEVAYLLGHFHRNRGRVREALQAFQQVAEQGQDTEYADDAWWYLGWVHYGLGDYDRAIQAWGKLLSAVPASSLVADTLYWQARAFERLGRREEARTRFERLQTSYRQTYYGHLANARLTGHAAWPWEVKTAQPSLATVTALPVLPQPLSINDPSPHARRARELWDMRLFADAGEELAAISASEPNGTIWQLRAAQAFHWAGEHHRAMSLLRRYGKMSQVTMVGLSAADLQEMTYPLGALHRLDHTSLNGFDPLFVGALVMAESDWDPHAFSRVGARGLMQLMPETGRRLARTLGIELSTDDQLFDASLNLRLGAAYLAELLQRFDGSLPLMFASYNAGEDAVSKWWAQRGSQDIEEFIADIPYRETRRYVQRVFVYYAEYHRIYRGSPR